MFPFVDSCGGTYSGGTEDPPPFLFVEYAPIIIHWKKVHVLESNSSLKFLSENYSLRRMDNNIICYATSLFKFLNALYVFCDKITFFIVTVHAGTHSE